MRGPARSVPRTAKLKGFVLASEVAGTVIHRLYLNRGMFTVPAPLQLGTGAKRYGSVRGFGTVNENLTLTHQITSHRRTSQFSIEGRAAESVESPYSRRDQVSGNRQVQVSGRIDF